MLFHNNNKIDIQQLESIKPSIQYILDNITADVENKKDVEKDESIVKFVNDLKLSISKSNCSYENSKFYL